MRHIIPISGKYSLAAALVQLQIDPSLDYEYVFNPTGAELPCVFEWIKKVETYLFSLKKIVLIFKRNCAVNIFLFLGFSV